jgi:murein DD-endopeptidase MepM/ murein hydrolase activator NlpD
VVSGQRLRWLSDIRLNLPPEGTASVIVTDAAGARYITLRREEIDGTIRLFRATGRALLVCFGLLAVAIVALLCRLWQAAHTNDTMEAALASLRVLKAGPALYAGSAGAPLTQGEVDALVASIKARDAAFTEYVEATAGLAQRESTAILASLREAGLRRDNRQTRQSEGAASASLGGAEMQTTVLSELRRYVIPKQQDTLIENTELRRLLRQLPAIVPVEGGLTTSGFGIRLHPISHTFDLHKGVDFVSDKSRQIRAAADGTVAFVGERPGYGNVVILTHTMGLETLYAHLDRIQVTAGQAVRGADPLGLMGNTGSSTGTHLHFETRVNGSPIDPDRIFRIQQHAVQ